MPIRTARRDDLSALCAKLADLRLIQRYGNDATKLREKLEGALERGEELLVYDEDEPSALCWYTTSGTLGLGGYLRLIAVAPDVQSKGVGAELLRVFEEATFAVSGHAFLLVSDFNIDAQRFYQRHGYTQVGSIPKMVLEDVDELIYWKKRPS